MATINDGAWAGISRFFTPSTSRPTTANRPNTSHRPKTATRPDTSRDLTSNYRSASYSAQGFPPCHHPSTSLASMASQRLPQCNSQRDFPTKSSKGAFFGRRSSKDPLAPPHRLTEVRRKDVAQRSAPLPSRPPKLPPKPTAPNSGLTLEPAKKRDRPGASKPHRRPTHIPIEQFYNLNQQESDDIKEQVVTVPFRATNWGPQVSSPKPNLNTAAPPHSPLSPRRRFFRPKSPSLSSLPEFRFSLESATSSQPTSHGDISLPPTPSTPSSAAPRKKYVPILTPYSLPGDEMYNVAPLAPFASDSFPDPFYGRATAAPTIVTPDDAAPTYKRDSLVNRAFLAGEASELNLDEEEDDGDVKTPVARASIVTMEAASMTESSASPASTAAKTDTPNIRIDNFSLDDSAPTGFDFNDSALTGFNFDDSTPTSFHFDVEDTDDAESIADSCAEPELPEQWRMSPKERLGLGVTTIRRDEACPWDEWGADSNMLTTGSTGGRKGSVPSLALGGRVRLRSIFGAVN
ncbi:hypothetical protein EJ06DRAFT_148226 [Trichodelitschia bisporula]|uniref:Uncharacterized protein n=1 Tax=Trichodelitschia bisporula TaxID=703511 RepID=A0A6G1HNI9_9PEZI|nr:hypothetical protein EJ06DRAFT_148226 [Trichodelitschia bisporula]